MSSEPNGDPGVPAEDRQQVGAVSGEQIENSDTTGDATAVQPTRAIEAAGEPTMPAEHRPTRRAFGWTYWMLNSIEMFERLAYFGIRGVVPIYIMQATEPGGLHLTALHKGWIYGWWAILQSWLPMFTGGIADRYGYKRVLVGAISANVVGYVMMAYMHSYYGFFAGILVLATGTAFFKPALQGSIAQSLTKETSSLGWGIFYWVVNIGAMLAPVVATVILGKPHSAEGWQNLFLASAAFTACNLLLLLTFRDVPSGADKSKSLVKVFVLTIENVWVYWFRGGTFYPPRGVPGLALAVFGLVVVIVGPFDSLGDHQWMVGVGLLLLGTLLATWLRGGVFTWQLRLPAFLLIMSCFWMMMYQLWDLHPNFIEDWIDSASVADYVPFDSWREYGDRGLIRVPQQILLTFFNAFLIILLIVPISWFVRKMRTLSAMLIGMGIATAGVLIAGLSGSGWILIAGITCFSFGEMLTGPKKNQYLGLIAPPGKKGLYLGYVNIPIGVGVGLGSIIAGVVYDNYGEKAGLALKYLGNNSQLVARAAQSIDWSDSLETVTGLLDIDRSQAFDLACTELGAERETAADILRSNFRYDQGQIQNLALQYIAVHPRYRDATIKGFAEIVRDLAETIYDESQALVEQADRLGAAGNENSEAKQKTATGLPATEKILHNVEQLEAMATLVDGLASGDASAEQVRIASFVHLLPDVVGHDRVTAFGIVRDELVNGALPPADAKEDAEIVDILWQRFGPDGEVLNNLALEYLAQGTSRLRDSVAALDFEHSANELDKRIEEMERRIGIGRTKAFAALSAALGATEAELDQALAELDMPGVAPADRPLVYLANQPHHRFLAVARKDWTTDQLLLQTLVSPDAEARRIVLAEIDHEAWYQRAWNAITGWLGADQDEGEVAADGVNYHKLANNQDLIQKALAAKDWTNAPKEAGQLLGLNLFEARALVAAEVNSSPQTTTRLLWVQYDPQYKVWIPFAAIGVLAAIALGIFGQMAKRWADMNA